MVLAFHWINFHFTKLNLNLISMINYYLQLTIVAKAIFQETGNVVAMYIYF